MLLLQNKKARAEFEILKTLTAGIQLSGPEVKSLRLKNGSLRGSFIKIIGSELFLLNAHIAPYSYADNTHYDSKRSRKLLVTKREREQLVAQIEQKKVTLVPLTIELRGRFVKVTVGVAKGLKKYEKRARIKARDQARDTARELKQVR